MNRQTNFHHIPDSVLLHIFNFLSRHELAIAAQVSKRWLRISRDGALWKHMELESKEENDVKEIITKNSCSLLTRMNLSKCNLTPEFMVTLSGICTQLRELTLQKCFFARQKRRFRLHTLRNLKTLDARLLRGNSAFVLRLLRCTPNVEMLAVDETIGSSWNGKILRLLSKLRLLDLSRCIEVTDEDIEIMATSCPSLESLLLIKCFKVSGYALPVLLRNCKMLRTLSLAYTRVTDDCLRECNWKNSTLKELDFSSCYFVSSRGLRVVFAHLSDAVYINLSNCSENSAVTPNILSDMMRFRSLQVLNLDDGFVTSEANEELICQIAHNCPYISCLLVGITLQTAGCLERCLQSLEDLKRFGISAYPGIDDPPLVRPPIPVAIPLNGFGLDKILNTLATYCHKLEALQLSGYRDRECETVTNAFVNLLRNCENLSRICSFGGNTDILVMAADAQQQTRRHDIRLIKPTMLFPTPRTVTPPPNMCFDRVVYNKETSTIDDPWRGPFVYEVQRNRRFWIENAYE